jgi:hypothetical protein
MTTQKWTRIYRISPQYELAFVLLDQPMSLQELIKHQAGKMTEVQVHKYVDNLIDSSIADANWVKKDTRWVRELSIKPDCKDAIRKLKEL